MPNWAHAGFNVTGDRAELARFRKMMIRPQAEVGRTEYFDIPPPGKREAPGPDTPEGRKLTLDFNGIIPMPSEAKRVDPERWAVDNWGTKWNAQEVDLNVDDPDNIWFQFSTAWEFPEPVFDALAEEFPTLVFAGSAYFDNEELELVGEFNGDDSWGPGEIMWLDCG